ncbi:hypothetical protein [Catellatospora vulcania]|uniref:hypothetical protein n=1 Tax=Catellatospora vulcania TaxID=1460450 RepID=UPI0012D493FA|nr:hypothetical protein [Catellatospora vulcania]
MTVDDLRRQLTDEYEQERFTMTVGDVEHRAGRSRRRVTAWVIAGTAALLVVGALVRPPTPDGGVDPLATPSATVSGTPAWQAGFAAECDRKWLELDRSGLRPEDRDLLPPLRIERFDGELGIRVYGNDWLTAECERTTREVTIGTGRAVGNTRGFLPDVGTGITYIGHYRGRTVSSEAGPQPSPDELAGDYLVGRVPSGATAVTAVASDGQRFRGQFGGGFFLVWAPRGGLDGALVEATVGSAEILVAQGSRLPGGYDAQALDAACGENLASAFAAAGRITMPPRRFALRSGERALHLYGSPNTMVACSRVDGMVSLVVTRLTRYARVSAWPELKYFVSASSAAGWVTGVAPEGATGGTVTLNSGRKIPLQISQGWFACRWTAEYDDERPVRIQVAAGSIVYSPVMNGVG